MFFLQTWKRSNRVSNHSHRAAQEILQLIWRPDFHHKNIVIAIFTGIFYTSYYSVWGFLAPIEIPCCQLTWNMEYNLANLGSSPASFFKDQSYIVPGHFAQLKSETVRTSMLRICCNKCPGSVVCRNMLTLVNVSCNVHPFFLNDREVLQKEVSRSSSLVLKSSKKKYSTVRRTYKHRYNCTLR